MHTPPEATKYVYSSQAIVSCPHLSVLNCCELFGTCYSDRPYHTVKNLVVKNAKFGELCTTV